MTYEEALRELRDSIRGAGYQCHIETYEKAIEALEKQIPKKLILQNNQHGKCPNCGSFTIMDYCAKCGQKIDADWIEEE